MHIRLLIIAATLLLGASRQTFGAINGWTAIGPSGGHVNKIVFNKSTPGSVYAIAAGGFYRSLDGGKSWQLIKSDFENPPEDLAIDPSDPTRVYVVAPNYPLGAFGESAIDQFAESVLSFGKPPFHGESFLAR